MLKKNLKKIKKRQNKKEKDKKEAVEKQRILPRSRQMESINENKKWKNYQGLQNKVFCSKKPHFFRSKKIADIIEKIVNKLVKTLKRIVPLKL